MYYCTHDHTTVKCTPTRQAVGASPGGSGSGEADASGSPPERLPFNGTTVQRINVYFDSAFGDSYLCRGVGQQPALKLIRCPIIQYRTEVPRS
jgi:hypothetical protein